MLILFTVPQERVTKEIRGESLIIMVLICMSDRTRNTNKDVYAQMRLFWVWNKSRTIRLFPNRYMNERAMYLWKPPGPSPIRHINECRPTTTWRACLRDYEMFWFSQTWLNVWLWLCERKSDRLNLFDLNVYTRNDMHRHKLQCPMILKIQTSFPCV